MTAIHLLAIIAINAIFGSAYALGKLGVDQFPPYLFAGLRAVLVALALLPFLKIRTIQRHQWPSLILFSALMGVSVYATMFQALALTESVSPIVIGTQLSVPFAVLLGWIFLKEYVNPGILLAILVSFSGIIVVAFDETVLSSLSALIWCAGMALSYGGATVISRQLKSLDARVLNAWMALLSTPPLIILSFLFEENQWQAIQTATILDWTVVLHAALAVGILGHVGMFALLRRYPLAMVMPFYVLTPLFGVAFSIILFDESLTLQILIGVAMVLGAIFYINKSSRKQRMKLPAGD